MKKFVDIYFKDLSDEELNARLDYCQENKLALESFSTVDVSDQSYTTDTISRFSFSSTDDALVFKLKFK